MTETATLVSLFLDQARARGAAPALKSKRGDAWQATSWAEWERRSRAVAAGLVEAGVAAGDRVAIFGTTREEWVVTDMAVLLAGAVTVPIYPSLIGEQAAYILDDSGARVLVAEDASFVRRVADASPETVKRLARTMLFAELPSED